MSGRATDSTRVATGTTTTGRATDTTRATPGTAKMWCIGDSKTNGTGDDTPPALGLNGYPPLLIARLNAATTRTWTEVSRDGIGGITTAQMALRIMQDATTTLTNCVAPDVVLINLGTNDISSTQGQWETDYATILDAIHATFPTAKVYCGRHWRSNTQTNMNAIDDTWIPDVISTRSSWAFLGMDERTFLPGTDNGATYTVDGIHPNHAGYLLEAAAWQTTLGY